MISVKKWLPWWAFTGTIILAVFTVWLRLSIIRTTYRIHTIDSRLHILNAKKQQLEIQLAALKSPGRLQDMAKSKFKLSQPKVSQRFFIYEQKPNTP
jgi:cell division protein FtsL